MPTQIFGTARPNQQPATLPAAPVPAELETAYAALGQQIRSLDLRAIPEITSAPKVELVPLGTLQQRRQLAERANAVQRDPKASQYANIQELDARLRATGQMDIAKCTGALLEALNGMTDLMKTVDLSLIDTEAEREVLAKRLEPHKLAHDEMLKTLAIEHGYFLDLRKQTLTYTVVPVDAVLEVTSGQALLRACIVGVGGKREPDRSGGQAYQSGFAVIDSSKLRPGISMSRMLANEFGHLNLNLNRGITSDTPLPATPLTPPVLPAHFAALPKEIAESLLLLAKPRLVAEVHELESDVWSSKVELQDIDRIVENGIMCELTGTKDLDPRAPLATYRLSSQLALGALFASYANDGKSEIFTSKIEKLHSIIHELEDLRNQAQSVTDNAKLDSIREQSLERFSTLMKSTKQVVSEVPDSYRKQIREQLEYFADAYIEQLTAGIAKR